jgi:hypothetical protein
MTTPDPQVAEIETAISGILGAVSAMDPPAAAVVLIIQGLLAIAPEAIDLVKTVIAQIEGKNTDPVSPQIQTDTQAIAAELAQPLPSVSK